MIRSDRAAVLLEHVCARRASEMDS
jgi:hypothetical protein